MTQRRLSLDPFALDPSLRFETPQARAAGEHLLRIDASRPPARTTLAMPIVSSPQAPASPPISPNPTNLVTRTFGGGAIPQGEVNNRPYYGRNVDLTRIEQGIVWAEKGMMAQITDISREAVKNDPNLAGLLLKRFSNIAVVDWDVSPADGDGLDPDIAREIANDVRQMIAGLRGFRQDLYDLAWARFDGRSALEIQWRYLGGKRPWRPLELDWIHPARLSFGPERELRIVERNQIQGYFRDIGPALRDFPAKYIWWMPRALCDYQEREGLAPACLYWAFFKRFSWRHRMQLTELFGLPWRIVEIDKEAQGIHTDQLNAARMAADELGGSTSAAMPPGMKLRIESGNPESAEFFGMTSEQVDAQLQKLIAGSTAPMESDATRASAGVGDKQQDFGFQQDGNSLSERIVEQLVQPYIELNRGHEMLVYTPRFQIRTQPSRDRKTELDRVKVVFDMGVPIAHPEIREIAGLREPKANEAVTTGPVAPPAESTPVAPGQAPNSIESLLQGLESDFTSDKDAAPDMSLVVARAAVARCIGAVTPQLKDMPAWIPVAQLEGIRGLGNDDVRKLITQSALSAAFVFRTLTRPGTTDGNANG